MTWITRAGVGLGGLDAAMPRVAIVVFKTNVWRASKRAILSGRHNAAQIETLSVWSLRSDVFSMRDSFDFFSSHHVQMVSHLLLMIFCIAILAN